MPAKRNIMPEEVRNAKLLLSKGLSDAEVAAIIGRSVSAVINIRNGAYDFMLADVPNDTPDDSRVCILLKSIDSRLYQQNEDMKKAIDRLTAHLEQAIQESEDAWKLASREFTDGWRKVSNPKSRHPAVVETLKNNNRLTRKVKAAKARHERWVKIKALWADTAL